MASLDVYHGTSNLDNPEPHGLGQELLAIEAIAPGIPSRGKRETTEKQCHR
jgi:hypothetical protein